MGTASHSQQLLIKEASNGLWVVLCTNPVFGKSDPQFKGNKTQYYALLASDRGVNERSVNVSKRSESNKEDSLMQIRTLV